MKKSILILSVLLTGMAACKRDDDDISQLQTLSRPTISFPQGRYFSINTNGTVPNITASAYDSVIGESYNAEVVGRESIDVTTPGLYVINATSKNKYGFSSSANIFVAVTNVNPAINLSGTYKRAGTGGIAQVTEVANGLYITNNVGGVVAATNPSLIFDVAFAHLNDTTIQISAQSTGVGILESADEFLRMAPGDTTFGYRLSRGGTAFGTTALRTFKKQ
jgi:hypothetical protein